MEVRNVFHKKNEKMKRRIFIGICAVLAFVLFYYGLTSSKLSSIESLLKDGAVLVQKIVLTPFTTLNQNKGKDMTESYTIQKNINVHLEQEIQELKKMLDLNQTLTEYTKENALVLSRNRSYWFQNITIDKGKKAGIKKDMIVITSEGLIGKITKVSSLSSEVSLITTNDLNQKVSVSIAGEHGESFALLSGYNQEKGLLKDNVITTSGLGGMYPKGIYIGKVKEIEEDKYNLSKTIYIETKQDFNKIHYVTVLKEKQS